MNPNNEIKTAQTRLQNLEDQLSLVNREIERTKKVLEEVPAEDIDFNKHATSILDAHRGLRARFRELEMSYDLYADVILSTTRSSRHDQLLRSFMSVAETK